MMKKNLFPTAAVAAITLALAGCQENPVGEGASTSAIEFNSVVDSRTRATDTAWDNGDKIGVFMFKSGMSIDGDGSVLPKANALYTTVGGDGKFAAEGDDILTYPIDGSLVNFVAYYPYNASISNYEVPLNVAAQSNRSAIEFLYAATSAAQSSGTPTLRFSHKLSKVVFNVSDADDTTGASLAGMTTTISGLNTKGSYDLKSLAVVSTGSPADMVACRMGVNAGVATVEAIVLPEESTYTVTFELADGTTATAAVSNKVYAQGKQYTYTVNLKSAAPEAEKVATIGEVQIDDYDGIGNDSDLGDIEKTPATPTTAPAISGITPASLEFEATGGSKDIAFTLDNPGGVTAEVTVSGLTAPLSATVSGTTITVAAASNDTGSEVSQTMTVLLNGSAVGTVAITQAAPATPPATSLNLLFPGSDFETATTITGQFTTVTPGVGIDGSSALVMNGATGSGNVDGSKFSLEPNIASATSVSFWVKGTSTKGICVAFNGNNSGNIANIGACGSDTEISAYSGTANYNTAIDTNGQWVKVTLTNLPSGIFPITVLCFRAGKSGTFDLAIDNIIYE